MVQWLWLMLMCLHVRRLLMFTLLLFMFETSVQQTSTILGRRQRHRIIGVFSSNIWTSSIGTCDTLAKDRSTQQSLSQGPALPNADTRWHISSEHVTKTSLHFSTCVCHPTRCPVQTCARRPSIPVTSETLINATVCPSYDVFFLCWSFPSRNKDHFSTKIFVSTTLVRERFSNTIFTTVVEPKASLWTPSNLFRNTLTSLPVALLRCGTNTVFDLVTTFRIPSGGGDQHLTRRTLPR